MIFLAAAFLLGMILIFSFVKRRSSEVAIFLPLPKSEPSRLALPSPTSTIAPEILQIENDLSLIENDIGKLKKEDRRLVPPSFVFDLNLQ